MEELLFNIEDCENANITTPNTEDNLDLISEMQESPQIGSTNFRDYTIEISRNCCVKDTIVVPVFYNFTRTFVTCSFDAINDIYTYGFNLSGINPLFISQLRMSKDNGVTYSTLTFTNLTGNTGIRYNMTYPEAEVLINNAPNPEPPNTEDYNFILEITHVSGFVYVIEMTFRLEQPGGCFLISSSITDITYPEFDERLVFDIDSLDLLSLFQFETSMETGVYEVIICRNYVSNPLTISSLSSTFITVVKFPAYVIVAVASSNAVAASVGT